jgi:hypothetical protein
VRSTTIIKRCIDRAVNEATRPGRGKSGRDEAGRGATRRAGIGWALPTGWIGFCRARASSGTRAPFTALCIEVNGGNKYHA